MADTDLSIKLPEQTLGHHDHARCVHGVLVDMETVSAREGLNVTPVRRRVLEILLENHTAMGAYDILKRLGEDGHSGQPPVVYRALDFLQQHGFVHKIEGLNAFVACMHPSEEHTPVFLICRRCNLVAETRTTPLVDTLSKAACAVGFQLERTVIEAQGLCPTCQEKPAA